MASVNYIGGDIHHCDEVRAHVVNNNVEYLDKRGEVINLAKRLLEGKPVKVIRDGTPYTLKSVFLDYSQHHMFIACCKAALSGNVFVQKDVLIRCARYAVSQYLFEGEDLGFSL